MDKMNLITNKNTITTDQNKNNDNTIKHKVTTTVEIDEIRNRS